MVEKMKAYPHRFIHLEKPENDYIGWYRKVQERYGINTWLTIEDPDPFLMQVRYSSDDGSEYLFMANSHLHESRFMRLHFSAALSRKHSISVWNPENGDRQSVDLDTDGGETNDLGPAESLLFAFDREKAREEWRPLPVTGEGTMTIDKGWIAEFRHCRNGFEGKMEMEYLADLKEIPEYVHFSGTVIYRTSMECNDPAMMILNLGKVYGTSELKINGESCGVKWYGRRIYSIEKYLRPGMNNIEVIVTTSMGNYMKSLTDNPVAQYWTNAGTKNQPLQPIGMTGPVTCYRNMK